MIQLGHFRLDILDDGRFELKPDAFTKLGGKALGGGAKPRVLIGFNSLLIRGDGHTILLDPGTGNKQLSNAYREYRLEWPRKVFAGLDQLEVDKTDVTHVLLTHLHWDHCGASTSVTPDGLLIPTFPRATYYLSERELTAARQRLLFGDDGYIAADFEPLIDHGKLTLLGHETEIVPGIRMEHVGGHSAGLQIVEVAGGDGTFAIYLSDLVPTAAQLALDSVMSYDEDVDELISAKRRVLDRAAERHDLLIFVHGPRTRAGYITQRPDGDYQFDRIDV